MKYFVFSFMLNLFKKLRKLVPFTAVFVISAFLFSCNNIFDTQKKGTSEINYDGEGYVLKGTITKQDADSTEEVRAAVSDVAQIDLSDTQNYRYKIYLDDAEQNVSVTNGEFSLSLNTGSNVVKVVVQNKRTSLEGQTYWVAVLQSEKTIDISNAAPHSLSEKFVLSPIQDGTTEGHIDLSMSLTTNVNYVTATLLDESKLTGWSRAFSSKVAECTIESNVAKLCDSDQTNSMPFSGSYKVQLDFYDNATNKNILYSTEQIIEVYANLSTTKWRDTTINSSTKPSPVKSDGSFEITQSILDDFVNTTIYVDPQNGLDTNGGTYYGKFKTLQKAVDTAVLRNNLKNSSEEFNIYLCGDVNVGSSAFEIDLSGIDRKVTFNIKSNPNRSDTSVKYAIKGSSTGISSALLKIKGKASNKTTVNLCDIQLNGNKNNATDQSGDKAGGGLYCSNALVNIENCIISNNIALCGIGIYIDDGCSVNLTGDTEIISNNNISDNTKGGGVYIQSGSILCMSGNAVIGRKSITNGLPASFDEDDYGNGTYDGGGVYNCGKLYLGYKHDGSSLIKTAQTKLLKGIYANYARNNGAGIYSCNGSSIILASGYITYNKAAGNGGGVYITKSDKNTVMIMCESAVIGDDVQSTAVTSGSSPSFSNYAKCGGGVYNNGANVYLSYVESNGSINKATEANVLSGGIKHNAAYLNSDNCGGGGIYNDSGNVYFNAGKISYNYSAWGGGGIYNDKNLYIEGGSLLNNKSSRGGAVYNHSSLEIGGSPSIPNSSTTEIKSPGSNDIYVALGDSDSMHNINIASGGISSSDKISITPEDRTRSKQVVDGSSDYFDKFIITKSFSNDVDWVIVTDGKIDADFIVSKSGKDDDSSYNGTYEKPFKTIEKAAKECWNSGRVYKIFINGTLEEPQVIPDSSDIMAKALEITKLGSNSGIIDAKQNGRALTISTVVPVTITNITIQNGKAPNDDDEGGGIIINKSGAIVNLGTGVKVIKNEAFKGGGVYIDTGATLCLYDNAEIGKYTDTTNVPTEDNVLTGNGNKARGSAGGVHISGNLYLGKKYDVSSSSYVNADDPGKICYNYAGTHGGGVYVGSSGSLDARSFFIDNNYAGTGGGGIYTNKDISLGSTSNTTLSIKENKAGKGGAIYTAKKIKIVQSSFTISYSYANSDGNDIYLNGTSSYIEFTSFINPSTNYKPYIFTNDVSTERQIIRASTEGGMTSEECSTSIKNFVTGHVVLGTQGGYLTDDGKLHEGYKVSVSSAANTISSLSDITSAKLVLSGTGYGGNETNINSAIRNKSAITFKIDMAGCHMQYIDSNLLISCGNVEELVLPSNTIEIRNSLGCTNVKKVTIYSNDGNLTNLSTIFKNCSKLETIRFIGTKEQWNAISRNGEWLNASAPVTVVTCDDGTVSAR
nr:hypothetical protein [uncultured Treponema sp.]